MRIKRASVRKLVTLSAATMARVDRFQAEVRAPSTSDALRMLVADGLAACGESAGPRCAHPRDQLVPASFDEPGRSGWACNLCGTAFIERPAVPGRGRQ